MPVGGIDYITIKGFKSIKSVEQLELGPITVLIGPNGSGKSNFIDVFSFLRAIRDGELQRHVLRFGGADRLLHFGSRYTDRLALEIGLLNSEFSYGMELVPTADDMLFVDKEYVRTGGSAGHPETTAAVTSPGPEAGVRREVNWAPKLREPIESLFDGHRTYHFNDTGFHSPMKKTAEIHDNRLLRTDGSNLAAFLYLLRERHAVSYEHITRTIQLAAPFFVDFELEPEELNPNTLRLRWKHSGPHSYFDASSLSDGTLRFMALATLFLQPDRYRPSVIVVDEPELGLHPYAITLLASMIQEASVDTQVVVSTQSSFLVDHFEPEDIVVADRIEGSTHFTRLSSENLENWLKRYSLGQLWEKNIIGGRPRPE